MPKLKLKEFNDELDKELGKTSEEPFAEDLNAKNKKDWQDRGCLQVLGLAVEKYLTGGGYSDNHPESEDILDERYKLVVKDLKTKNKYLISLSNSYGTCYSGNTSASHGHMKIEKLEKDIPLSHIPTEPTIITGFSINSDDLSWNQQTIYALDENGNIIRDSLGDGIEETVGYKKEEMKTTSESLYNNVFSYSNYGGNLYYPTGGVSVRKELFTPLARAMENRPVWIIEGASGTGKSTLAGHLQGLTVFETDSVDELPEVIKADVIVLGNRSGFKRDDITKRIFGQPDVEIIGVSFAKQTKQRDYLQEKMETLRDTVDKKNREKRHSAFIDSLKQSNRERFGYTGAERRKFEAEYEAAGKNLKLGKTSGQNGEEVADIQTKEAKKMMRDQRIISAVMKSQKENPTQK